MPLLNYNEEKAPFKKIFTTPWKQFGFNPEKGSQLYISAIPEDATIEELCDFFEPIGDIFEIKLMTKGNDTTTTYLNRGFGYVTYINKELAETALNLLRKVPFRNGINNPNNNNNNKTLRIYKSSDNSRLFLGGLPVDKTKDEIWNMLKIQYLIENLVDVIAYSNTTNRGYVFLEFRSHGEAAYFRSKFEHKLYLFGRKITVNWAKEFEASADDNCGSSSLPVKIIFLRHLDAEQSEEDFTEKLVYKFASKENIQIIHKFESCATINLKTQAECFNLVKKLQDHFKNTIVEIELFSKPPGLRALIKTPSIINKSKTNLIKIINCCDSSTSTSCDTNSSGISSGFYELFPSTPQKNWWNFYNEML